MKRFNRLILLCLLIAAAVCLSSCQMSKSQQLEEKMKLAEELMLQRRYAEAAQELETFDWDKKAVLFAKYCRALDAGEQDQFETAAALFQSLEDYRDSQKMYTYYSARQHEENAVKEKGDLAEEYLSAVKQYQEIPSFRDSQERIESCYRAVYDYAARQAELKQYDIAEQVFLKLEGYQDSATMVRKCKADALYDAGRFIEASSIYRDLDPQYRTHEDDYETQYEEAAELKEKGQYAAAEQAFSALGDYQDSQIQARESGYLKASELLENKQFDEAEEAFADLDDYLDSGRLVWETRYRKAVNLAEAGKYREAVSVFEQLSGYQDSKTLIQKAYADELYDGGDLAGAFLIYQTLDEAYRTHSADYDAIYTEATELHRDGEYEEAHAQFVKLGTYKDSETMSRQCRYDEATELREQKRYDEAAEIFESLGDYQDSAGQINETRYMKAKDLLEDGQFDSAAAVFDSLADYRDSGTLLSESGYRKAMDLADKKQYDSAAAILEELKDYRDSADQIFRIQAEKALDNGLYGEAIACYDQITDKAFAKSREKEAYYRLGEKLLNEAQFDAAAAAFSAAGDYPNAAAMITETWLDAGNDALKQGRYDDARGFFSKAEDPERARILWQREAETRLSGKDYEGARICFSEAGNEGMILESWNREAEEQLEEGKYAEARQTYTEAGMSEKIPDAWNLEGENLLSGGNYDAAKAAFLEAGNRVRYEDTVLEQAKALMASENYEDAYALLTEIQEREEAGALIRSNDAFIRFRIRPGDTIILGSYEQDNDESNGREPIEWTVLAEEDNHALLISKFSLDCKPYNEKHAHVHWQNCTLRTWLNGGFAEEAFTEEELNAILTTDVDNSPAQGNEQWETDGGKNTKDRIFLLSYQEAGIYFPDAESRMCAPTAYAASLGVHTKESNTADGKACGWWWLRSPGHSTTSAARIGTDGNRSNDAVQKEDIAVRPILWLDLTAGDFGPDT